MNRKDSDIFKSPAGFHLERVCFARIFDAPNRTGSFSFEADGKRQFGVQLFDGPVPRAGSHYAVVLAEKENWQTIVGWRDLSTSDVYLRETAWQVASQHAWMAYFGMPLLLGMLWFAFGGWAALLALVLAIWAVAVHLRRVLRRSHMIDGMLRSVAPHVPIADPPRPRKRDEQADHPELAGKGPR